MIKILDNALEKLSLYELQEKLQEQIRDKAKKKQEYALRSLSIIKNIKEKINE